eukprot:336296_1
MSCDNTASNITSDANVNPSESKISSDSGSACLEHNINPNGSCHTKLPSPQTTNSTDLAPSLSQIDHKSSNRPIAASHRPKKKNAQSLRLLSMEAYFRQVGREQTQKTRLSVHLASSRPYVVPFRSVEICFLHEQVQPDHILNALNGTIVSLAVRNSDISECSVCPSIETNDGLKCHFASPICNSLGLGLIRAIDTEKKLFYVLTPIPSDQLTSVNLFLRGNIETPLSFMFQACDWQASPYLTSEALVASAIGSVPMKSRQNIVRGKK